jgi:hypothetical protein
MSEGCLTSAEMMAPFDQWLDEGRFADARFTCDRHSRGIAGRRSMCKATGLRALSSDLTERSYKPQLLSSHG